MQRVDGLLGGGVASVASGELLLGAGVGSGSGRHTGLATTAAMSSGAGMVVSSGCGGATAASSRASRACASRKHFEQRPLEPFLRSVAARCEAAARGGRASKAPRGPWSRQRSRGSSREETTACVAQRWLCGALGMVGLAGLHGAEAQRKGQQTRLHQVQATKYVENTQLQR